MGTNNLYSYHIFSFPFIIKSQELKRVFDAKADINQQIKSLGLENWKYVECIYETKADEYNKRVFFHPHVHDIIFSINENEKKNDVVNFVYELDKSKPNKYVIEYLSEKETQNNENSNTESSKSETKDETKNKTKVYVTNLIELDIDKIVLKLYSTGVGILSYFVKNEENEKIKMGNSFKRLKLINELGRRIYPEFISINDKNIEIENIEIVTDKDEEVTLGTKTSKLLAYRLKLILNGDEIIEDFKNSYNDNLDKYSIKVSKTVTELLPNKWFDENLLIPLNDDRMHVTCFIQHKEHDIPYNNFYDEKNITKNSYWHELLYIDGNGLSCQSKAMLEDLLKKHTYTRWIRDKTLYGITYYSFICCTVENDFAKVVNNHIQNLYYEMICIVLALRASILSVLDDISHLNEDKRNNHYIKRLKQIYYKFIDVLNLFYFNNVSPQIQGQELYKMLLDSFEVEKEIEMVKTQVNYISDLSNIIENSRIQKATTTISIYGIPIAVVGILFNFLALQISQIIYNNLKNDFSKMLLIISISGIVFCFTKAIINAKVEEYMNGENDEIIY